MKIVDQRAITLTQDEVVELVVAALCASNPGFKLENRRDVDVDLRHMEVRLVPLLPRPSSAPDGDGGLGP